MSKYQPYPEYKDSGVEWIGEVPDRWEVKKLKFIAYAKPSNVDKKSKDGEKSVLLCNYTDVYYNDFITNEIDFMKATATDEQIKKFTLEVDDVIITKDSEGPDDIAIATCVQEVQDNLVCGYHLTHIKPTACNGRYLFRAFNSDGIHDQFKVAANGITRYGIGIYGIDNAWFPLPPLQEQQTIANYLDKATAKIDTLIEKQQQLIALLKEKRQAVISHAVTKGLDPNVKMKDSGVEWLGEVPEHWEIGLLSSLFLNNKVKNTGLKNTNLLSLSYGRIIRKNIDTTTGLRPDNFNSYQIVQPGYIILRLTDLQNDKKSLRTGLVIEKGIITSAYVGLAKKSGSIGNERYFHLFLHTFDIHKGFYGMGAGVRQGLNFDELKKLKFTLPPIREQNKIVEFIDEETTKIDTLIEKSNQAITLLKERRSALISAVVTGKIDVRGEK